MPQRRAFGYTARVPGERHKDQRVAHYLDLFEPLGGVTARSVFGEYGFFARGVMFALIWQGTLYVRTNEATRRQHEERGLKPFVYVSRAGRHTQMPYYELPPEAFETPGDMSSWARPALEVSLAAAREKLGRKRRKVARGAKKKRVRGAGPGKKRSKAAAAQGLRHGLSSTTRAPRKRKKLAARRH
jgi:DNA transformation protein and related proteins